MKIITHYDPPPIPVRDFDWSAYDSDTYDYDAPLGHGPTKEAAIMDLMDQLEDALESENVSDADTARLDWLIENAHTNHGIDEELKGPHAVGLIIGDMVGHPDYVRFAIDQAMKGKEQS